MNETEKLQAAVQDERARRRWAERELAAEVAKSATWRERAEDRTDRIRLLEGRLAAQAAPAKSSSKSFLATVGSIRRVLGYARRRPTSVSHVKDVADHTVSSHEQVPTIVRRPTYAFIKVARLGGSGLPFLREFDAVDLVANPDALYDADLVFVATATLADRDAELLAALIEWTALPARQPLVIWNDAAVSAEIGPIIEAADLCLIAPDGSVGDGVPFSPGSVSILSNPQDSLDPQSGNADEAAGSDAHGQHALAKKRLAHRFDAPSKRASQLLTLLAVDAPDPTSEVGVLLISNKPEFVFEAVESALEQENVRVFLVVGLHGDPEQFGAVRERLTELLKGHPSRILEFNTEVTLGECLNQAAGACSSSVLAKFDDDDWYGPHYLEDALASLEYTQADLVGKACYFVEIEESGDVYLVDGPEESFTNHLIGSSLVFRRSLWEQVPFPHRPSRVDSIFLRGVRAIGAKIYSNSRYEFGVRRREGEHTWIVDPAHFAARGRRVGSTFADIVVDVDDSLAGDDA